MQYDYATLTFLQIRCIAHDLGITVTREHGKLSARQTWIDAIEAFKAAQVMDKTEIDLIVSERIHPVTIQADADVESITESITESVTTESITESITDKPNPVTNQDESITSEVSTKRGALTVVSVLVAIAIVIIQSLVIGAIALARCGLYIIRLFGKYDPDLDLWYQLQLISRRRQPSHA